jgi:hypothetical protein
MTSSSPNSQGYIVYFSLFFWAYTNSDFDMLQCRIAFVLLHCFIVLHCHISLICYIFFNMSHCFDMLHCHIAWYAALILLCCISFICYIAFDMLHYFEMLHCHIALICYIATLLWYATLLLFCYILIYINAYYNAQWWKWDQWDECGNIDQHYCTIKISASNNMKQIGYSIKLKSESI